MAVQVLSRLQFAGTVMFHHLFPPLTIGPGPGLVMVMVIIEAIWLRICDESWKHDAQFWMRIFALNFALGIACSAPTPSSSAC
jgi:cytochrome d ubiquinol oxidase subunit I